MATSTLKLYADCNITTDKSFLVENLSDYLSDLIFVTVSDFQYIKHGLQISIKIDTQTLTTTSEAMLSPDSSDSFNYCSIKNSTDSIPFYYFILDKQWTSSNTVTLNLVLDSINTFTLGTHYDFTDKTKVYREHKDRIYNSTVTVDDKTYYRRKIDFESEGIQPLLYKNSDEQLLENQFDASWYVMYKAENKQSSEFPPEVIGTYIFADRPILVKGGVSGYQLDVSRMSANRYFFGSNVTGSQNGSLRIGTDEYGITEVWYVVKSGSNLRFAKATGRVDPYTNSCQFVDVVTVPNTTAIIFNDSKPLYEVANTSYVNVITGPFNTLGNRVVAYKTSELTPESSGTAAQIDDITTVDRSNTTLMKIIKLPYAPFELNFNASDELLAPDYLEDKTINWKVSEDDPDVIKHYLKVKNSKRGAFENLLDATNTNIFEKLFTEISNQDLRNDDNESKLLHSDYYQNRFVYDSFAYPVRYENLSEESVKSMNPDTPLEVNFVTTSTVNSRFLFDFKNIDTFKSTNDYDHLLVVDRNNEVPLFNSDYLNYIRTGYNYDKKIKNAAITQGVLSTVGGAVALAAGGTNLTASVYGINRFKQLGAEFGGYSGVLEAVRQGYATFKSPFRYQAFTAAQNPTSTVLAAGQVTSGISSIVGGITGAIQAEQNFQQKQEQMKQASVTVAGADDIDLLSYYTDNKAKICEYSVSEKMKEHLADLFYYCGYACDEQKKPDLTTRKRFNYLQADAELENKKNIQQIYLDDIKARWATGVTVLHQNPITDLWDFTQRTANNESWL